MRPGYSSDHCQPASLELIAGPSSADPVTPDVPTVNRAERLHKARPGQGGVQATR